MLWKGFFAASKIRAVQIRAMQNRASRGMPVMKTTYFSPAIFEISTSLFFSPGVPIIIIMTLIDPLPPADAVYFKKEIKITPINLLNSIWHKVVYSSFLLCIV